MPRNAPARPAAAPPAGAGAPQDWRQTLIQEFTNCVGMLNQQIANTIVTDPMWQALHDQRQQYWNAIQALQGNVIDGLLAGIPNITAVLTAAANDANQAASDIKTLSGAVGLAASLLVLATAIATAASTGSPSGILSAAQGVIKASGQLSG